MKLKLLVLACGAGVALVLGGCGEPAPAEKPPEARATPKLVENAPDPDPAASAKPAPQDAKVHGYSPDGKPGK